MKLSLVYNYQPNRKVKFKTVIITILNRKMIDNSSKRLAKIKKKLKKPSEQSGEYSFLIKSMQGNKENYVSNKLSLMNKSLKNSTQLMKPSAMISSLGYSNPAINKINLINNKTSQILREPVIFQNIKFLKNSRILDDTKSSHKSKQKASKQKANYQKNKEISLLSKSKNTIQLKHNSRQNSKSRFQKSGKLAEYDQSDFLEQKVLAFVQLVKEIFDQFCDQKEKNSPLMRKKYVLDTLANQILKEIANPQQSSNNLAKSVQVSKFSAFNSKALTKQPSKQLQQFSQPLDYQQIINSLSSQNSKLTQLISEHQKKNIQLFVKMNENESKEIEKCKKYLSVMYDKYKLLEKAILKENKKGLELKGQKEKLQERVNWLEKRNKELNEELLSVRQILEQQEMVSHNGNLSKLTFEEQPSTVFNFSLIQTINPKLNKHLKDPLMSDKSFMTRRDKASSCLQCHKNNKKHEKNTQQAEIMSCTTITKSKNLKKKNSGKAHESQAKCIEPKSKPMQSEVNQKSNKFQLIIQDQLRQIQKLLRVNKNLSRELTILKRQNLSLMQKNNQQLTYQTEKNHQLLVQLQSIKNHQPSQRSVPYQLPFAKMQDEYRVIALQAKALQKLINNNQ